MSDFSKTANGNDFIPPVYTQGAAPVAPKISVAPTVVGAPVAFAMPTVEGQAPQMLSFNPLDDKARFPYRNRFEPFKFRLLGVMFLGMGYMIMCMTGWLLMQRAVFMLGALPLLVVFGLALYLAKPEFWIKIDRLTGQLELRKTRFGCSSGPPALAVPVASVARVVAEQLACARRHKCSGRSFTIMAYLNDGAAHMLTPAYDLKEQRATDEALKLMNSIRLCRGEPLVLQF